MKVKSNKFTGVYIYHSTVRTRDECYYINYRAKGKSINEKVGWKSEGYTQGQANKVRIHRIHQIRHGEDLPDRAKNVPLFRSAWIEYICIISYRSLDNVNRSQQRYYKYLSSSLGNIRLNHITPKMIRDLTGQMEVDGLKDATIYQYHGLIRRTFDHMIKEEGYQGPNPMKMVKTPVPKESRERYLSKQEASKLLEATGLVNVELFLFTLIGLFTGMRKSEIMNIRGRDIDYTTNLIRVRGKGDKIRYCEMNTLLRDILVMDGVAGGDSLFKRTFNQKKWQSVVDKLGLNDGVESNDRIWRVTPHTLRHTFGSWLAQAGTDLMVIKELMGHSNIQTTMRYAKLQRRPGVSAVANLTEGVVI